MQRSSRSDACSKRNDWPPACVAFQLIKRCQRSRTDLGKSRGSCAAAESWIIDSPDFDGAVIPHLGLSNRPAFSAIRVAIKTQEINVRTAIGPCPLGLRNPHFQLSIFERHSFPNRTACIDGRSAWKQNQVVRQMTKKHRG